MEHCRILCQKQKHLCLCQMLISEFRFSFPCSSAVVVLFVVETFPYRISFWFLTLQLICILSSSREENVGEMNESLGYQRQKMWERWMNLSVISQKFSRHRHKYSLVSRRAVGEAIWSCSLCVHCLFEEQLFSELDLLEEISNHTCPQGGYSVRRRICSANLSDKSAGLNLVVF